MKNKVGRILTLYLLVVFLLAGCWDEREIENLAFVSAIAIDLAEEEERETMFEMTEQLIVPTGLETATEPGMGKAYRNLSDVGESIFEINWEIASQENRRINIEHLGLVIVSKELAEEENLLANVLDVFIRQQFMRRGILLAIADGKAKDFLEVKPEHITVPARYITQLLENSESLLASKPLMFGEAQKKLLTNRSYRVPQLSMVSNDTIRYDSIAIIQEPKSKLMGTLQINETKGLHLIIGEDIHGTVSTSVGGEAVSYQISESSSEYKLLNEEKEKLTIRVDIDVTADLMEYFGSVDFYKKENLERFEGILENRIEELADETLTKLQEDLKVDVLDFDEFLRIHHNKLWKEIEDNWDHGENYFSQSEIIINANATLTEPGTSTRVNEEGE